MGKGSWKALSTVLVQGDPPPKKRRTHPINNATVPASKKQESYAQIYYFDTNRCAPVASNANSAQHVLIDLSIDAPIPGSVPLKKVEKKITKQEAVIRRRNTYSKIPQKIFDEKHYYWNSEQHTVVLSYYKDLPPHKTYKNEIQPHYWKNQLLVDKNFEPISTELKEDEIKEKKWLGSIFTVMSLKQKLKNEKTMEENKKASLQKRRELKQQRHSAWGEMQKDSKVCNDLCDNLKSPTENSISAPEIQIPIVTYTHPHIEYAASNQHQTNQYTYFQGLIRVPSSNWGSLLPQQLLPNMHPCYPVIYSTYSNNQQATQSFLNHHQVVLQSQLTPPKYLTPPGTPHYQVHNLDEEATINPILEQFADNPQIQDFRF